MKTRAKTGKRMKRRHPERLKSNKRKKRVKLPKFKKVYQETWDLMSLYVRMRDNWTCITCGVHLEGRGNGMQAGHGIHGNVYDFHFKDINAQCNKCNFLMKHPNIDLCRTFLKYKEEMDKKWGVGTWQELEDNRHNLVKYTRGQLLEIQEDLKNKISQLMSSKAIEVLK